MKKPLLFALSAGALGYLAYASGVFEKVPNRIRRGARELEQSAGAERLTEPRARRREISHRTAEGLLDLNTASQQELEALNGIGPVLAERIVENRPYLTKIDLVGRMVIPELAYEAIKHDITVSPHAA